MNDEANLIIQLTCKTVPKIIPKFLAFGSRSSESILFEKLLPVVGKGCIRRFRGIESSQNELWDTFSSYRYVEDARLNIFPLYLLLLLTRRFH